MIICALCVVMVLGLSACGDSAKKGEDSAEAVEEPIHLEWWVYLSSTVPEAMDEVLQKANEISAEKIGVTVDMHYKNEEQFVEDMGFREKTVTIYGQAVRTAVVFQKKKC